MHVHAFSPMEIVTGAARAGLSIREFLHRAGEAGLDTIPGTAAEILDDEVRWVLTKGKLPAAQWVEVVTHRAPSWASGRSSTMMYGHVDDPRHWLGHLRVLAAHPGRAPAGSPSSCRCRSCTTNAPIYLAGVARPGPTLRDNRAVHAMARLLLHGRIDNIQVSWVKLGDRRHAGDAARRRQRPRRHADGGDDQPDGRLRARLAPAPWPSSRRSPPPPAARSASAPRPTWAPRPDWPRPRSR